MSYVEEHYSPLQSSIITALVEQGRLRYVDMCLIVHVLMCSLDS